MPGTTRLVLRPNERSWCPKRAIHDLRSSPESEARDRTPLIIALSFKLLMTLQQIIRAKTRIRTVDKMNTITFLLI